jgi:3-hydroxyisobutyrate dehydrogenase-like beta-hydroxyacid dehydrogenase
MVQIAVLGLGEAGSLFARDLVDAGAKVVGYDPAVPHCEGIPSASSEAEAVDGAALVLALTPAADAPTALRNAVPALRPGQLYADLSTASDQVKRSLAAICAPTGARFADVALMSPVPGRGVRTPMLASGPAAPQVAQTLGEFGATVEVVGAEPGEAAVRKLLRSIFYKGLAAAVTEALDTAERYDLGDWLRAEIAQELDRSDAFTVERLVEGSRKHAERRAHEMEAAAAMARGVGVEPHIADAARLVLEGLRGSSSNPSGDPFGHPS